MIVWLPVMDELDRNMFAWTEVPGWTAAAAWGLTAWLSVPIPAILPANLITIGQLSEFAQSYQVVKRV